MNLKIEVLSAKGLTLDVEYCQTFQARVLLQSSMVESDPVSSDEEGDIVFNFTAVVSSSFGKSPLSNAAALVNQESPILIYITSKPSDNLIGDSTSNNLIAAAVIDYRFSLFFSPDYMSVELLQCDQDGVNLGIEAGILYVRITPLQISDKISAELEEPNVRRAIEQGIDSYQEKLTASNKLLYRHARTWWSRVRRNHAHVENRNVRILAEDECGSHRFACSMLCPIIPPRDLISPRFAARFISLIPLRVDSGLRGGRADGWRSAFATMCRMQGSVEDHALLLCSILLGWGLDAWVAMGIALHPVESDNDTGAKEVPYTWVITFEQVSDQPAFPKVTFWDAVEGTQYEDITNPSVEEQSFHHFRELHALFNHNAFAVNVQHLTSVTMDPRKLGASMMSFDLSNERYFQILTFPEPTAAKMLMHPGAAISLRSNYAAEEIAAKEFELEASIKEQFRAWRAEIDLKTYFDDMISVILQPALASYEWHKAVQVSFGNADFQSALKSHAGKGDVFKGCPMSFNHTNVDEIMRILKRHPAVRDIAVTSEGLRVSHAIRAKITPYPGGVLSVWVMIAVCIQNKYHSPAPGRGL